MASLKSMANHIPQWLPNPLLAGCYIIASVGVNAAPPELLDGNIPLAQAGVDYALPLDTSDADGDFVRIEPTLLPEWLRVERRLAGITRISTFTGDVLATPVDVAPNGNFIYILDAAGIKKVDISAGSISLLTDFSGLEWGLGNSMELGPDGFLYATDSQKHQILKVDTSSGAASLFTGKPGEIGAMDGSLLEATFFSPSGLALDAVGNLYVSEAAGNRIRKISNAGEVSTLSVSGLSMPKELTIDADGHLVVANSLSNQVYEIDPTTGELLLIIGSGQVGLQDGDTGEASFTTPSGLAVDADGAIWITGQAGEVRKVDPLKSVSTVDFGEFSSPSYGGIGASREGAVFITVPDGDEVLYLEFDYYLSGQPAQKHAGNSNVSVLLYDGTGNIISESLSIEVNAPPVIISESSPIAVEGEPFEYVLSLQDPNGDTPSLAISSLPGWLSLQNGDTLAGTPGESDIGQQSARFVLSDNRGGEHSVELGIEVMIGNLPPEFLSGDTATVAEDQNFNFPVLVADSDEGDELTLEASGLPAWLSFVQVNNTQGSLSGLPLQADTGFYQIGLSVTDLKGESATQTLAVTVQPANDAPVFTSAGSASLQEDSPFTFTVTATDEDAGEIPSLSTIELPGWLVFADNGDGSGILSGTPLNEHVGSHSIQLKATDLNSVETLSSLTLEVANSNNAPSFTSASSQNLTEDVAFQFTVIAQDVDVGETPSIFAENLPGWLSFTDNQDGTGSLSGTPLNDHVGSHSIQFKAMDPNSTETLSTLTLLVANTNDPPIFTSSPTHVVAEDSPFTYTISASDPDQGDNLSITITNLPAWLIYSDNQDGTGILSGTPLNEHVGSHTLQLQALDSTQTATTATLGLQVSNTNDPPVFTSALSTSATEDSGFTFSLSATDVDAGDLLTLTAKDLPDWLALADHGDGTATLSATPLNQHVGIHTLEFEAEDSAGAMTGASLELEVINTNDPVTWVSKPPSDLFPENTPFYYELTVADVDPSDDLELSAPVLPSWLSLHDNGDGKGSLQGRVPVTNEASQEVTLHITDNAGSEETQTFTVKIQENASERPTVHLPAPVTLNFDTGNFEAAFEVTNNSLEIFYTGLTFTFKSIPAQFSVPVGFQTDDSGNPQVALPLLLPGETATVILPLISGNRNHDPLSIPVSYSFTTAEIPFSGISPLGSGYYLSPWFGLFQANQYPWVWQETLGWIRVSAPQADRTWFFRDGRGWVYISQSTFPYMLDNSTGAWLYLPPGTYQSGTQVYDYSVMGFVDW